MSANSHWIFKELADGTFLRKEIVSRSGDFIIFDNNLDPWILPSETLSRNLIANPDFRTRNGGTTDVNTGGVTNIRVGPAWFQYGGCASTTMTLLKSCSSDTIAHGESEKHSNEGTLKAALTAGPFTPAAGDYEFMYTRLLPGPLSMRTANGTPLVITFWVQSSLTGTYSVALGLGSPISAASNYRYVTEYTINVANTPEKKTIVVPANVSAALDQAYLIFGLFSGATQKVTAGELNVWSNSSAVVNRYFSPNHLSFTGSATNTWRLTRLQVEPITSLVGTRFEVRDDMTDIMTSGLYDRIITSATGRFVSTTQAILFYTSLFPCNHPGVLASDSRTFRSTGNLTLRDESGTSFSASGPTIVSPVNTGGGLLYQISFTTTVTGATAGKMCSLEFNPSAQVVFSGGGYR